MQHQVVIIAAIVIAIVIMMTASYVFRMKQIADAAAKKGIAVGEIHPMPPNNSTNGTNGTVDTVAVSAALDLYKQLSTLKTTIELGNASAVAIRARMDAGETDPALPYAYESTMASIANANDSYSKVKEQLGAATATMNTATMASYTTGATAIDNAAQSQSGNGGVTVPPATVIDQQMVDTAIAVGVEYYVLDNRVWIETQAIMAKPTYSTNAEREADMQKIISMQGDVAIAYQKYKATMDVLAGDKEIQHVVVANIQAITGIKEVSVEYDGTTIDRTITLNSYPAGVAI